MRKEKDFLGEKLIEEKALYGIHSLRAKENFPDERPFHIEWYKAIGLVKKSCYETYKQYSIAVRNTYTNKEITDNLIDEKIIDILIESAGEVSSGMHYEYFIVPGITGGAGTSINMNVNEIIANVSLIKYGKRPGEYKFIDPIEHCNIFQSTNDVIPTSLRICIMELLNVLEGKINKLRFSIESLEKRYRNSVRIGYTQMQEAVPTSFGNLFSTYNDALSRDWWRISKCFERIKVVNIGGSAIGTGITVPRFFIMEVINNLQSSTGLPITRGENLSDSTNNLDSIVEVHSIIKAHAVNLEKILSDIRILSSDLTGRNEVKIPARQVGSSIMPGKINPVIPEYIISVAHLVYSNDILISGLCAQGCLELNAYIPIIGHSLIDSLKLLIGADETVRSNLFEGLEVNTNLAESNLFKSPAISTALVPYIGYNNAAIIAKEMKGSNIDIFAANKIHNLIETKLLEDILKLDNLLKLGYSLKDIYNE
ncbi:MAG: aspartate ammonia-lyase [Bacteroidetes bacterium GWE2_29_8]|nr:MAG: aspartate ammonia-lyase [Bacteroidetes bacterium GWE2_29_8]